MFILEKGTLTRGEGAIREREGWVSLPYNSLSRVRVTSSIFGCPKKNDINKTTIPKRFKRRKPDENGLNVGKGGLRICKHRILKWRQRYYPSLSQNTRTIGNENKRSVFAKRVKEVVGRRRKGWVRMTNPHLVST